jgi:hypothetical protein
MNNNNNNNNNNIINNFNIIHNSLNDSNLFNSLEVTNYKNLKITLNNSLNDIINHFLLPIFQNDINYLTINEIKLFKLQLWLEEK